MTSDKQLAPRSAFDLNDYQSINGGGPLKAAKQSYKSVLAPLKVSERQSKLLESLTEKVNKIAEPDQNLTVSLQ